MSTTRAAAYLSWRQCRSIVRKPVAGFRPAGLQPGGCVSVASSNDIMYPMLFLGPVGAGGTFSGSDPAYTPYEFEHHVKTAKVKLVVAEPELLPTVLKGSRGHVEERNIFVFNVRGQQCPSGSRLWEWLLGQGEQDRKRFDGIERVARLTTSGTTGPPKMELPKSASGKILKRVLRDEAEKGGRSLCNVPHL